MKRNPREILFERHRTSESKLDRLREGILRASAAGPMTVSSADEAPCLALKLWRELIWPVRRFWIGLAAVWMMIGFLYVQTIEEPRVHAARTTPPSPEFLAALEEQRRMLSELINAPYASAGPAAAPRPRSGLPNPTQRA